jgi:uracil-DNA glycosylase
MPTEEEIFSAKDLGEIANLISICERCELYKTKTKDVPGVGNEKAEVMFIGEAPGKEEDLKGEPFVGAAGKYLTEMIEGIGWKRENVFIANVLKHRPPSNRDPLPDEIDACWPYLKRQIEILNPLLIVFLGRHAMQRFFPSQTISKVHGQAFRKEFAGRKQVFLALYHPAAALYNGSMREVLEKDFAMIPAVLEKTRQELDAVIKEPEKNEPKQEKLI